MSLVDGKGSTEHPSFGKLQISRVSSNKRVPLYGTSNQCRETIQLTISTSKHNRDLSQDWYLPGDELITVEMSPAQYAEAISSLNMGSGIPVTIRRIKDQGRIPDPPYTADRDLFNKEFDEKIRNAMETMNSLIAETEQLKTQKTISKKTLTEHIARLERIRQEIVSNVPFIANSFSEHMDGVVSSAKIEFDAFAENQIHKLGLGALKDQAPKNNLLTDITPDQDE